MVSIIIPCYNERDTLPLLIKELNKLYLTEIIVVDDNSPDGTGLIAEKLARENKNIKVIHRPAKLGLCSAIWDGLQVANKELIVVMDADLQHPPELLSKMIEASKETDIVIASRYIDGSKIIGFGLGRKVLSKLAIGFIHFLFTKTRCVSDVSSGYFLFKRKIIENIRLRPIGFHFLPNLLVKTNYNSVIEIPYCFSARKSGKSKMSIKVCLDFIRQIITLRLGI